MKNKTITINNINKIITRMDKNILSNSDEFKVAQILLSALSLGADRNKIADFTNIPKSFIYKIERRLRSNGVWKQKKTACEWFDKKTGGVEFWCDVSVGLGFIKRCNIKGNK
jgi:hypothetical protein